jgi:alkanesulfonate monooxygenase SsuD/methylene tetrahydromethanopterin reductase-like flavin-dependent oxidoreductase (luciferase family)
MFEGWLALTAWAQATERVRIGLMVGANTFREPALVAKMATTLDHISGGRAILGIGGAWFDEEHTAFGIPFGDGFPERLRWLGEALPIMRGMLRGQRPSAVGTRYRARAVRNDPPPVQERLPILIGGGGEKVTLKLVARYADANNVGGGFDDVRRKEEILLEHCARVGRDPSEIERTASTGVVIIRDSRDEARQVFEATFERNGRARPWENQPVGTPEDVTAHLEPFLGISYRHFVAGFPASYDEESMTRLAAEVRPKLQAIDGSGPAGGTTADEPGQSG